MKTLAKLASSCRIYDTCVFWYTSSAFHKEYMVHVYFGKFMSNVPKVHVSAVKTQLKHMKKLAKLWISCRIYGTSVFWYTCKIYETYMILQ
jgi:hypothetical protein